MVISCYLVAITPSFVLYMSTTIFSTGLHPIFTKVLGKCDIGRGTGGGTWDMWWDVGWNVGWYVGWDVSVMLRKSGGNMFSSIYKCSKGEISSH